MPLHKPFLLLVLPYIRSVGAARQDGMVPKVPFSGENLAALGQGEPEAEGHEYAARDPA